MNKVIVWVVPAILITALIVYFVTEDRYKKLDEKYNTCQGKIGQTEKEKAELLAMEQQNKATYDQLMNQLQKEVGEGQVAIQQYEDKLTVNVAEKIFFDSGSAELKPGGKELLQKFGRIVKGLADKVIRVEGHTDNVPIAKLLRPTYPTNWELSAARAITVVRFLQDSAGVPPKMLMAAAFGPYQPIAANDTPANKQKNRRIEIVLQQRDVLKRTEAPIAPAPKGPAAETEAPGTPVTKEAPTKTEAPAAPAK
ncbi:MAG: OmpA family protein [Desulfobacterales bacterium]|nr:OmpA family protein [Desulfobacterales bacterium]